MAERPKKHRLDSSKKAELDGFEAGRRVGARFDDDGGVSHPSPDERVMIGGRFPNP